MMLSAAMPWVEWGEAHPLEFWSLALAGLLLLMWGGDALLHAIARRFRW